MATTSLINIMLIAKADGGHPVQIMRTAKVMDMIGFRVY